MHLYLYVSADKYELPMAVASSAKELAEMIGVQPDAVYRGVWAYAARGKSRYRVVKIPYDPEIKALDARLYVGKSMKTYLRREPDGSWTEFPSLAALAAAEFVGVGTIRKRMWCDRQAGKPPRYKPKER